MDVVAIENIYPIAAIEAPRTNKFLLNFDVNFM